MADDGCAPDFSTSNVQKSTVTRVTARKENKKLKVAVYCRVSTRMERQEDSLEMQKEAYIGRIEAEPDWELAGVYADNLSGLSAEKRPEFMRMIQEALDGNIDLILCKSVSRFSRSVAECKKYTDMLRLKNVTVEFEKENLRTDDPSSDFLFSLMSAIAESESRSISENVRWAQRERVKRGEYNLGNNRILGYDSVNGKLVPNKDAEAVRLIFVLYANGESIAEIQRRLLDIGIHTKNGTPLSRSNIMYILGNETYKGDKLLQKNHPKDMITKRSDPNVPYESNYLEDDHEAIVEPELWEAVQKRQKVDMEVNEMVGHRAGQPHFLFGKVFCGECGEPMVRRTWSGKKVWVCRDRNKGKEGNGCTMRNVPEQELLDEGQDVKKIIVTKAGLIVG